MALGPAGIHAVEHLGPVLGLGAAGAGVELQNGIGVVILAGEQRGHPGLLDLLLQTGIALLQLGQQLLILGLLAHFAKGVEVLPLAHQLFLAADLVLQLLEAHLHLLGPLQVVPEPVLCRLVLQALGLLPGTVHVQRGGELLKLRTQVPQLLLVFVVFDQSHGASPFHRISLAIVLYWKEFYL